MRPRRFCAFLVPLLLLIASVAWPRAAEAQRRARVIVRGGVYGPVFYDPWYSWGWGYPWYGYQWGYPYPYPYGYGYGRYDQLTASIRLEVTPQNTEVYVDGYRAGVVDDYDGFFQRLRLRPGEHDLTLYLDGYRTVHQHLYLNSGADQKVRYTMVPLAAGEQPEPRPQPPAAMAPEQPEDQPVAPRPMPRGGGPGRGGPGRGAPPPQRPQPGAPMPGASMPGQNFGAISVRVQPADADVLIDGERWSGPTTQDRLIVQLPGGRHRVEIRKDGYERYESDVDVRPGETLPLNISLLRR